MHFLFLFISVTCGFGYTWRDEREYCTKNSGMKSLFLLYVVYACGLFRKKTSNIFESSLDNNIFTKSPNKVLDGTPWKVYRQTFLWLNKPLLKSNVAICRREYIQLQPIARVQSVSLRDMFWKPTATEVINSYYYSSTPDNFISMSRKGMLLASCLPFLRALLLW